MTEQCYNLTRPFDMTCNNFFHGKHGEITTDNGSFAKNSFNCQVLGCNESIN